MINYDVLYRQLPNSDLAAWENVLPEKIDQAIYQSGHGELKKWLAVLEQLPAITPSNIELNNTSITIGDKSDCDDKDRQQLEAQLRLLSILHLRG